MRTLLVCLVGLMLVLPGYAQPMTLPWRKIPVPHGGSFSGIVETAPGHVLAATDGTVYRSEDGGTTWRPTGLPGVSRMRFEAGEVLALSAPALYPAESTDLYRSADGGRSWRRHPFASALWDVRRTPQGRLFVVNNNEVLASLDDGVTWQSLLRRPSYRIQPRLSLTPEGWPFVGVGLFPVTDTLMAYNGSTWAATVLPRQYPRPFRWTDTMETPDGTQYFAVNGGVYRRDAAAGWKRLVQRTAYTLAFHERRVLAGAADGIYGVEGDTGQVVATPAKVGTLSSGAELWAATDWYEKGSIRTSVRPPDGAYRIDPQGQRVRLPLGTTVEHVAVAAQMGEHLYAMGDGLWRLDPRIEGWTRLDALTSVFDPEGEIHDQPSRLLPSPDAQWLLLESAYGHHGMAPVYHFDFEAGRLLLARFGGEKRYGPSLGVTPQGGVLFPVSNGPQVPLGERCTFSQQWICETTSLAGSLIGSVGTRLYAVRDTLTSARPFMRSDDDGRTWRPTGGVLRSYERAHVGGSGEMVRWRMHSSPKYTVVAHSYDEGRTWQDSARFDNAALYRWVFGSGGRVMAHSQDYQNSMLYLSGDFGRTWTNFALPVSNWGPILQLGPNDELFAFGEHVWRTPWPLTSTAVAPEAPAPEGLSMAPNPFQEIVTATLTLTAPGPVRAEVFDALGRRVALLHDAPALPGPLTLRWEAGDAAPGVYVLRVAAGGAVYSARLVRSR